MSSEMDQFVLQYSVDLKDAVSRLEQLNQKVEKVNKAPLKGKENFGEFSREVGEQLGRVVPGVDRLTSAVGSLGAGFLAASAAVAVLGAGITAVINTRDRFNAQRTTGLDVGVSGLRQEEYARQLRTHSGGRVTREAAQQQIQTLAAQQQASYADPTRLNEPSKAFRLMGVDPGNYGQKITPFNEFMTNFATQLKSVSPEQARGQGKQLGLTPDFVDALRAAGPAIGQMVETSGKEVAARKQAEEEFRKLQEASARTSESLIKLEEVVASKLVPIVGTLADKLTAIIDAISMNLPKVEDWRKKYLPAPVNEFINNPYAKGLPGITVMDILRKQANKGLDFVGLGKGAQQEAPTTQPARTGAPIGVLAAPGKGNPPAPNSTGANAQGNKKEIDDYVKDMDSSAEKTVSAASEMALAVNMFSGAVSTFSNAVDERAAWAAWAGEVGRANNLPGASTVIERQNYAPGTSRFIKGDGSIGHQGKAPQNLTDKYDAMFEAAANKYRNVPGMSADLLKSVAVTESGLNPKAESGVGAKGLMQVMDSNKKATGLKDSFDPQQNIMAGAQILAENLARTKGDQREALKQYHGGLDKGQWGKLTESYPDKVQRNYDNINIRAVPADKQPQPIGQDSSWQRRDSKVGGQVESEQFNPTKVAPLQINNAPLGGKQGMGRQNLQQTSVVNNMAANLGLPPEQVALGGASSGDVQFRLSQDITKQKNQIQALKVQSEQANLPDRERSKILTQLADARSGLAVMQNQGGAILDRQQEGPRQITVGERAVVINISGTSDAEANAREVKSELSEGLGEILTDATSGVKI